MAGGDRLLYSKPKHPPYVALFIDKNEAEELNASGWKKVAYYHLSESELWTTYYDRPHELSKLVDHKSARRLFRSKRKAEVIEYLKRLLVADQVAERIWVIYDYSRTTLPELPGGPNEMRGFVKGCLSACGKMDDIVALPLPEENQSGWKDEYDHIRQKRPVILFERRSDDHGGQYSFIHPDLQSNTKKVAV